MSNVPKLRFQEFSGEWENKKLGQIVKVIDSLHQTPKEYVDIGLPMIRVTDVNNGDLILDECLRVTDDIYIEFTKKYEPQKGDIIMSRVGTCGASIILKSNDKVCLGQNTVLLTDSPNQNYLFKLITSSIIQNQVNSKVVGSTQKTLSLKDLKNFNISLPSKQEQEKIASFLTSLDSKIEQLTKKEELLKQYKKGVMQQIFSQKIRFKADDGSEFEDWEEKKLEDFTELQHGDGDWILSKDITSDGEYKIVQLGNIGLGIYIEKDLKTVSSETFIELKGTPIQKGDLLINRMVDNNLNSCIFNLDGNYITSVDVCWIRENQYFNNYFLMSLMITAKSQQKLLSLSSGSGRVRISKKNLFEQFTFELPCLEEQTKIANFLSSIDSKIEQVSAQLDSTKEFKKALLQQMFV